MAFNEDSRVKIPALLHLARLDYQYIPRNQHSNRIEKNNIFPIIFKEGIKNINPNISDDEVNKLLEEISVSLEFDDLGKDFYQRFLIQFGNRQRQRIILELSCVPQSI